MFFFGPKKDKYYDIVQRCAAPYDLFFAVFAFPLRIQKPRKRVAFIRGRLEEFQPGETEHLVSGEDAAVRTLPPFPVQGQQCEHDADKQEKKESVFYSGWRII